MRKWGKMGRLPRRKGKGYPKYGKLKICNKQQINFPPELSTKSRIGEWEAV
jgi:hypothetical protein